MRKLWIILACVFFVQGMRAQTVISGTAEDINSVKQEQGGYVFAESTDKSEGVAVENVKALLLDQIESWSAANPSRTVPSMDDVRIIVAKRGPYSRAFAYVSVEESASPEMTAPESVEVSQEAGMTATGMTEAGSSLSEISRFDQLRAFIGALEEKELLIDYGKFATLPKTGDCYIVVYDRSGLIKAKLRRASKELLNLETGERDDLSNYPGCGALWFRTFNSRLN